MSKKPKKRAMPDVSLIANCARCGVRCRLKAGSPEARLLRFSDVGGFCINCATTEFLQGLDIVKFFGGFDRQTGTGKTPFDPGCLRLPHVQEQFAAILRVGQSDAQPAEIDWLEVIANWGLPFPKRKGKRSA